MICMQVLVQNGDNVHQGDTAGVGGHDGDLGGFRVAGIGMLYPLKVLWSVCDKLVCRSH